jgi:hypothetical protein
MRRVQGSDVRCNDRKYRALAEACPKCRPNRAGGDDVC